MSTNLTYTLSLNKNNYIISELYIIVDKNGNMGDYITLCILMLSKLIG